MVRLFASYQLGLGSIPDSVGSCPPSRILLLRVLRFSLSPETNSSLLQFDPESESKVFTSSLLSLLHLTLLMSSSL